MKSILSIVILLTLFLNSKPTIAQSNSELRTISHILYKADKLLKEDNETYNEKRLFTHLFNNPETLDQVIDTVESAFQKIQSFDFKDTSSTIIRDWNNLSTKYMRYVILAKVNEKTIKLPNNLFSNFLRQSCSVMLEECTEKSIFFTSSSPVYYCLKYLQIQDHKRNDIDVIYQPLLTYEPEAVKKMSKYKSDYKQLFTKEQIDSLALKNFTFSNRRYKPLPTDMIAEFMLFYNRHNDKNSYDDIHTYGVLELQISLKDSIVIIPLNKMYKFRAEDLIVLDFIDSCNHDVFFDAFNKPYFVEKLATRYTFSYKFNPQAPKHDLATEQISNTLEKFTIKDSSVFIHDYSYEINKLAGLYIIILKNDLNLKIYSHFKHNIIEQSTFQLRKVPVDLIEIALKMKDEKFAFQIIDYYIEKQKNIKSMLSSIPEKYLPQVLDKLNDANVDISDIVYIFQKGNKYGLKKGNEIIVKPKYSKIERNSVHLPYQVYKKGLTGAYSYEGKELLPCIYDEIEELTFSELKVKLKNKYGIFNSRSYTTILPSDFDSIQLIGSKLNGEIVVTKGAKKGVYEIEKNNVYELAPIDYDSIRILDFDSYQVLFMFQDTALTTIQIPYYTGKKKLIFKNGKPFELSKQDNNTISLDDEETEVIIIDVINEPKEQNDQVEEIDLIPNNQNDKVNENKVYQFVEKQPEFPGGIEACYKYIEENINYPEDAKKQHINGKVYVQFIVKKDGTIANSHVIKGVHPLLDKEAIRVIESMPKWKPGEEKEVPVNVQYTLPVKFTL